MLKRISIILILASFTFAQSPVDLYNTANASLEAGEVSDAENGFNKALEVDPTFAPAYVGLSRVAIRNGDLKKAGDLLKEAISADEENKEFRSEFEQLSELNTLMNKGIKSMKNGDADSAFESFRIANEKFPNYPESVFNMGLVHFRKKEYLDAVDYFHKTLA
ncbi:MAG: tetratricopeptide repeat protein, partial [Candidatus Marinimicrobia bacterium]|nr:tetratricopeptide repeat protein [Candidatus Neomarinimicrobiota bacterium]